jgi:hypothetical protein
MRSGFGLVELNGALVIVRHPPSPPYNNIAATTSPKLVAIQVFLDLSDSCVPKEVAEGDIT